MLEKFREGDRWRDCSEDRSVEGRTGGLLERLDWWDGGEHTAWSWLGEHCAGCGEAGRYPGWRHDGWLCGGDGRNVVWLFEIIGDAAQRSLVARRLPAAVSPALNIEIKSNSSRPPSQLSR